MGILDKIFGSEPPKQKTHWEKRTVLVKTQKDNDELNKYLSEGWRKHSEVGGGEGILVTIERQVIEE